jgi:hypothetical protein
MRNTLLPEIIEINFSQKKTAFPLVPEMQIDFDFNELPKEESKNL